MSKPDGENLIHFGDNLDGLRRLAQEGRTVHLVYVDPPYATGGDFRTDGRRANAVSAAMGSTVAYSDRTTGARYLEDIRDRLRAIRDLMRPEASIFVHIDVHQEHHIRVALDETFGPDNHLSSICRIKCNPKNFRRQSYGNIRDTILHYAVDRARVFCEPERTNLNDEEARLIRMPVEQARRTAPQNVWVFTDPQRPRYPTEKSGMMLRRIIETCSDVGQTVLDCYAGSGSTLEAAAALDRRFIGMDQAPAAERAIRQRLAELDIPFSQMAPAKGGTEEKRRAA